MISFSASLKITLVAALVFGLLAVNVEEEDPVEIFFTACVDGDYPTILNAIKANPGRFKKCKSLFILFYHLSNPVITLYMIYAMLRICVKARRGGRKLYDDGRSSVRPR